MSIKHFLFQFCDNSVLPPNAVTCQAVCSLVFMASNYLLVISSVVSFSLAHSNNFCIACTLPPRAAKCQTVCCHHLEQSTAQLLCLCVLLLARYPTKTEKYQHYFRALLHVILVHHLSVTHTSAFRTVLSPQLVDLSLTINLLQKLESPNNLRSGIYPSVYKSLLAVKCCSPPSSGSPNNLQLYNGVPLSSILTLLGSGHQKPA